VNPSIVLTGSVIISAVIGHKYRRPELSGITTDSTLSTFFFPFIYC